VYFILDGIHEKEKKGAQNFSENSEFWIITKRKNQRKPFKAEIEDSIVYTKLAMFKGS